MNISESSYGPCSDTQSTRSIANPDVEAQLFLDLTVHLLSERLVRLAHPARNVRVRLVPRIDKQDPVRAVTEQHVTRPPLPRRRLDPVPGSRRATFLVIAQLMTCDTSKGTPLGGEDRHRSDRRRASPLREAGQPGAGWRPTCGRRLGPGCGGCAAQ
jgi:hypothetical protein